MNCSLCALGHEAEFTAEMVIHFRGLKNVDKPGVWVFPKLLVCLECGWSRFSVPEKKLAVLAGSAPTSERSTAQQCSTRMLSHGADSVAGSCKVAAFIRHLRQRYSTMPTVIFANSALTANHRGYLSYEGFPRSTSKEKILEAAHFRPRQEMSNSHF